MQAQRKEQTGNLQTANAYAAPAGAIGVSGTPEAGLEHLASSAIHAGFRNFDDAVASYYAAQINTATPLAIEQRYSRNGRLPSILAAVYRNSQGWSEWERRAYNDEVMVSAERILERELQAFIGGHMFQELGRSIDRCHASRAAGDLEFGDQLMLVKKAVTIGLPQLWKVVSAVAATVPTRDKRSSEELALRLVLVCLGERMPWS